MTTPYGHESQPKPYPPAQQQAAGQDRFAEPDGYVGEQEFPAYPPTQNAGTEMVPHQQMAGHSAHPAPAQQQSDVQDWSRWRPVAFPIVGMLAFVLFMATRQWWWWMLIPLVAVLFNHLPGGSRHRNRGC
ncbi:hypothetical protein ACQCX2_11980 [Propionibacteriaceae bacterium Y1700]|uniref:hypothetical protein n=1 Tax=Microlunatus sp. Y1700 TaxID=3418487 RepID=UPI003DA786F0